MNSSYGARQPFYIPLNAQQLAPPGRVSLRKVLRPKLPGPICPAGRVPHPVFAVAGIQGIHGGHELHPPGLILPEKQRALHGPGRVEIQQEDTAFLVAEAGPIDASEAPQGGPDQSGGGASANRQPDRPGRVVLGILRLVPVGCQHDGDRGCGEALPAQLLCRIGGVGGQRLGQLVETLHGPPEAAGRADCLGIGAPLFEVDAGGSLEFENGPLHHDVEPLADHRRTGLAEVKRGRDPHARKVMLEPVPDAPHVAEVHPGEGGRLRGLVG